MENDTVYDETHYQAREIRHLAFRVSFSLIIIGIYGATNLVLYNLQTINNYFLFLGALVSITGIFIEINRNKIHWLFQIFFDPIFLYSQFFVLWTSLTEGYVGIKDIFHLNLIQSIWPLIIAYTSYRGIINILALIDFLKRIKQSTNDRVGAQNKQVGKESKQKAFRLSISLSPAVLISVDILARLLTLLSPSELSVTRILFDTVGFIGFICFIVGFINLIIISFKRQDKKRIRNGWSMLIPWIIVAAIVGTVGQH